VGAYLKTGDGEEAEMSNGYAARQMWAGIILIALGVLFLLDRLWVLNFSWFFRTWWPSLMILWGAVLLFTCRGRRVTGPLVLITLGAIFQIERLDLFYWWRMRQMWPLILIAAGVGLLISRLSGRDWNGSRGMEAKS
jgi:hypothetical protein